MAWGRVQSDDLGPFATALKAQVKIFRSSRVLEILHHEGVHVDTSDDVFPTKEMARHDCQSSCHKVGGHRLAELLRDHDENCIGKSSVNTAETTNNVYLKSSARNIHRDNNLLRRAEMNGKRIVNNISTHSCDRLW